MEAERGPRSAETVLETIRSRRVTRTFDARPVEHESLLRVLEAGRWATSGGGRRTHPFLVVRDPGTIDRLRAGRVLSREQLLELPHRPPKPRHNSISFWSPCRQTRRSP